MNRQKLSIIIAFIGLAVGRLSAQIYGTDTIADVSKYKKYVDTSFVCLLYIKENKISEFKTHLFFKKQDENNLNKNIEDISNAITKYGMPKQKNLLVTTSKYKINEKVISNVFINYYFPTFDKKTKAYKTLIRFMYQIEDGAVLIENVHASDYQTDEELLEEFNKYKSK